MNALKYLLSRLREPSTAAGLSVIGVLVGLPPGSIDLVTQVVVSAAAAYAAFVPDKK